MIVCVYDYTRVRRAFQVPQNIKKPCLRRSGAPFLSVYALISMPLHHLFSTARMNRSGSRLRMPLAAMSAVTFSPVNVYSRQIISTYRLVLFRRCFSILIPWTHTKAGPDLSNELLRNNLYSSHSKMLSSKEMIFRQGKDENRRRGDLLESLIQPSQSPKATWESFGFPASLAARLRT